MRPRVLRMNTSQLSTGAVAPIGFYHRLQIGRIKTRPYFSQGRPGLWCVFCEFRSWLQVIWREQCPAISGQTVVTSGIGQIENALASGHFSGERNGVPIKIILISSVTLSLTKRSGASRGDPVPNLIPCLFWPIWAKSLAGSQLNSISKKPTIVENQRVDAAFSSHFNYRSTIFVWLKNKVCNRKI